jgi:hypothetical protein
MDLQGKAVLVTGASSGIGVEGRLRARFVLAVMHQHIARLSAKAIAMARSSSPRTTRWSGKCSRSPVELRSSGCPSVFALRHHERRPRLSAAAEVM